MFIGSLPKFVAKWLKIGRNVGGNMKLSCWSLPFYWKYNALYSIIGLDCQFGHMKSAPQLSMT